MTDSFSQVSASPAGPGQPLRRGFSSLGTGSAARGISLFTWISSGTELLFSVRPRVTLEESRPKGATFHAEDGRRTVLKGNSDREVSGGRGQAPAPLPSRNLHNPKGPHHAVLCFRTSKISSILPGSPAILLPVNTRFAFWNLKKSPLTLWGPRRPLNASSPSEILHSPSGPLNSLEP